MSLYSFIFVQAQAQNVSNFIQTNNEFQIYILTTISKEAQEILKNSITNPPTLITPRLSLNIDNGLNNEWIGGAM